MYLKQMIKAYTRPFEVKKTQNKQNKTKQNF